MFYTQRKPYAYRSYRPKEVSYLPVVAAPKPKRRVAKSVPRAKGGFSLSLPGVGQLISANWRRPQSYGRAGHYLKSYRAPRTYGKASNIMSRSMAYGQSFNTGALAMGNDDGQVCLKHREFLGVINSSQDFTTQIYELNPGLSHTMPWASSIANNFQQYKIVNMAFEFVSTSATSLVSGTNTALGQVAIATQYDSIAPEFRNLNDMLNSQWATSTKISTDLVHPIESQRAQTPTQPLYTRAGKAPGDIRLYDLGRTTVAVYGCQSTGDQIGQIWISYEVCLYKPITYNLDGGNAESAFITCKRKITAPVQDFGTNTPMGGEYFANYDNIGVTLDLTPTSQKIILPAGSSGYYQIVFGYFGNPDPGGAGVYGAGNFIGTNMNLQGQFWDDGTKTVAGNSVVPPFSQNNAAFVWIFNVPDPSLPASIELTNSWVVGPMISQRNAILNITITQLNVGLDNFVSSASDDCCTSLQSQIDALTLLVQQLQEEEEKSEAESEAEEEKDHERDVCEEKLHEILPPLADPAVEAQRQALLSQLAALN